MNTNVFAMVEALVVDFSVAIDEAIEFRDTLCIEALPLAYELTEVDEITLVDRQNIDVDVVVAFLVDNACICECAGYFSTNDLSKLLTLYFESIDSNILDMWVDDICLVASNNGLTVKA